MLGLGRKRTNLHEKYDYPMLEAGITAMDISLFARELTVATGGNWVADFFRQVES